MNRFSALVGGAVLPLLCVVPAHGQAGARAAQSQVASPWMDASLAPEKRAQLVLEQMTLGEKLGMLHGEGMPGWKGMSPAILAVQAQGNGGAGLVFGVPRLGIPPLQISDAAYGVRSSGDNGRYSTALPANVASAASWDVVAACNYGALIGKELRAQGYNMTLGGGVNLTRDPRNGRTFEYMGEDPVLAGTMVGQRIRCEGAQHVVSDIKHFALNDQETGRNKVDVQIGERAARESDLLAFQIGLRVGQPKAVMCSYNGVGLNGAPGDYACENRHLLTDILKRDWGFKGFVISDWGATHSTVKASAAGLDQEQPLADYFGDSLKSAVQAGNVPPTELDEHVRRVLYAEFASGIVDDPPHKTVPDVEGGLEIARKIAEQSSVLLKNRAVLPLDRGKLKSIAVIGTNADWGMISGGGSAQVDPPGATKSAPWQSKVWFPTSPLNAIKAKVPGARVMFSSGENIAEAVAQARASEVAVIFAWQWETEDRDLPDLSLPGGQDALIEAVAAANPRTIVVLETGTAVTMPWLQQVAGVMEVWYAGSKGADAASNLLFGDVNPSGKLPLTFPLRESDLPRTLIAGPSQGAPQGRLNFAVRLDEGANVGYKWFAQMRRPVLFPFGFGLSYTRFAYTEVKVAPDLLTVTFTLKNTGARRGAEVAEVYVDLPATAGETRRLAGFQKVELEPGESRVVHVPIEPLALEIWSPAAGWERPAGDYAFTVAASSADAGLRQVVQVR